MITVETMMSDNVLAVLAVLALCLPFPSLSHRFKTRSLLTRYTQPDFEKVLESGHNHVDFLRSLIGGYALLHIVFKAESEPADITLMSIAAPAVILTIGTIVQTVRVARPAIILGPVFYLSGLTLLLPGSLEGIFAFVFGWGFAVGTKDFRHQLPAMAAALGLAGFFNSNFNPWLLLNLGLILIPQVFAVLSNKRIVFISSEAVTSRGSSFRRKPVRSEVPLQRPADNLSVSSNA